jgi:LmbE family N-acetylglucosaminyl deacetylase
MNIITSPDRPDLSQARCVLAVQPHYDDNDIGAGGTLAQLHDLGAKIHYLTVTNDLVGVLDPSLPDEQASARLKAEQRQAAGIVGVDDLNWLGYPDAGEYSYFDLRRRVIRLIRLLRPDFLFTCDPWLPNEAHRDHILTGRAVAEAALLYNMPRLPSDPDVDGRYTPYELLGVVFYFTGAPNLLVDISSVQERKHRAIDCYQAQFTPESMAQLHAQLSAVEGLVAQSQPFAAGEPLKLLYPGELHVHPDLS